MRQRSNKRHQRAFTLIELMVVVAIAGILATAALGFTTQWRRRNDFNETTRGIFNGLNVARGEAIKRAQRVTVEILPDTRMTVFVDSNLNKTWNTGEAMLYQFPIDPDGPLAAARPLLSSSSDGSIFEAASVASDSVWPTGMTIDASSLSLANTVPVAFFDHLGMSVDSDGEPVSLSIVLKDTQRDNDQRDIDISVAGALRIQ